MANLRLEHRKTSSSAEGASSSKRAHANLLVSDASSQEPKTQANLGPTIVHSVKNMLRNHQSHISGENSGAKVCVHAPAPPLSMELRAVPGAAQSRGEASGRSIRGIRPSNSSPRHRSFRRRGTNHDTQKEEQATSGYRLHWAEVAFLLLGGTCSNTQRICGAETCSGETIGNHQEALP